MAKLTMKNAAGKSAASVELPDAMFGIVPNIAVMHQVVHAQLAHRRAGTQKTKGRAEVSGGGKKPFSQKGTGNARQGSIRAPHFAGGAVTLGPTPRKYGQRTPKKMVQLALRTFRSCRGRQGRRGRCLVVRQTECQGRRGSPRFPRHHRKSIGRRQVVGL
jgi:large subunit ribosomal protein L4